MVAIADPVGWSSSIGLSEQQVPWGGDRPTPAATRCAGLRATAPRVTTLSTVAVAKHPRDCTVAWDRSKTA